MSNFAYSLRMIEALIFLLALSVILGWSLYDAKHRVLMLEEALQSSQGDTARAEHKAVVSEDNISKQGVAIYLLFRRDANHETGLYIERDPKNALHDFITERYERELDHLGRCVKKWRYTSRPHIKLLSEFHYSDGPSNVAIREIYYDECGAKNVWVDVLLDEKGRSLAFVRYRNSNDKRDVGFYEYDSEGLLIRSFEKCHVEWSHSLEDVPAKFHAEFPNAMHSATEYSYRKVDKSNPLSPLELQQIKRGQVIKTIDLYDGLTRKVLESGVLGVVSATHYFASEEDAAVTITIARGHPSIEVQIDLAKDLRALAERCVDLTT